MAARPAPVPATSQDRSPDPHASPVRSLGTLDPAGYTLLRDTGSAYSDGAERHILRLVRGAADVSSTSEEMLRHAQGWAQRYHLHPARANVLRALVLPADARVLEVGAGCGAITRYLGETCAVVDALEPVPARAAAAAARTADLTSTRVFVGEVSDVPAEPAYDVVIVIGVLEYVGAGSTNPAPYRRFLQQIADRLVPGGTLVLAIENRVGVKYLVGAPEDHTGRVFDSIESYPLGGHARTFTRAGLETLLGDAGLQPHTLGAFPDYKLTRVVFDEFPDGTESLLHRIPRFPSTDWTRKRPPLASERQVWENLVDAGLSTHFANSFVVLAGQGQPSTLWPAGRSAVFYSDRRQPELTAETVVERDVSGVAFRRHPLTPDSTRSGPVRLIGGTLGYQPGVDLPRVIAELGAHGAGPHLARWLDVLDAALQAGEDTAFDVVPHNLVLSGDGELHLVDRELAVSGVGREQIIRRGIYLLAKEVTALSPPSRWAPCRTVGEVMIALGEIVGLPADGSWLDAHVHDESCLQVHVREGRPAGSSDEQWHEVIADGMRAAIAKPLADLPLGERLPARYAALDKQGHQVRTDLDERTAQLARAEAALEERSAELTRARADLDSRAAELAEITAVLDERDAELAETKSALQQTLDALPAAQARRLAGRLLPRGSTRRAAVDQARRLVRQRPDPE